MDALVERGAACVLVLDVSGAALSRSRARLGAAAAPVRWIEADVAASWDVPLIDLWHDRAVFHFLTADAERARYLAHLHAAVRPGGAVVLATFALDGPATCSGLPVSRYSAAMLADLLGPAFTLIEAFDEVHRTPRGGAQAFCWTLFRRVA